MSRVSINPTACLSPACRQGRMRQAVRWEEGKTAAVPIFTASPISSIIFKAWQRLAEIGDLDTIRTMDALGLANVLGAKKVEKEKDLKFARAFIVSVDTWENIIKMRQNPEIQKNWIICFVSIN